MKYEKYKYITNEIIQHDVLLLLLFYDMHEVCIICVS